MIFTRNMKSSVKKTDGFSLLEVIIAVAILAFAVVGILEIRRNCLVQSVNASGIQTANMLAQRIIADIRLLETAPEETEEETIEGYEAYPYSVSVEDETLGEDLAMQKVTLRIKYPTMFERNAESAAASDAESEAESDESLPAGPVKDGEVEFVLYMRHQEDDSR